MENDINQQNVYPVTQLKLQWYLPRDNELMNALSVNSEKVIWVPMAHLKMIKGFMHQHKIVLKICVQKVKIVYLFI